MRKAIVIITMFTAIAAKGQLTGLFNKLQLTKPPSYYVSLGRTAIGTDSCKYFFEHFYTANDTTYYYMVSVDSTKVCNKPLIVTYKEAVKDK